jgi:hypothetical protein
MATRFFTLLIALLSNIFLFGCKGILTREVTVEKATFSTKAIVEKENISELVPELPRIGSTSELGQDETCGKSNKILAYAETQKYHIYICGDDISNQAKSMVVITVVGNYSKTVIYDNPSISWSRSYVFTHGNFVLVLGRPFSTYLQKPPQFYLIVRFANEVFIRENIRVYLFNEKITSNYQKTILSPNKQAKERFLKSLPTFRKQFETCKFAEANPPLQVEAYEIAPSKYLVQLTCRQPSYNGIYQYVLYSETSSEVQAKIIPFDTLNPSLIESGKLEKVELQLISGLPQFFPEDNTLRVFHKGIGAGGCGSAAEYKLIGERFELQEFRKYDCMGFKSEKDWQSKSPEDFPKIYP